MPARTLSTTVVACVAAVTLLASFGAASASGTGTRSKALTIKQARDETRRQAVIELSAWDWYPRYTGLEVEDCDRKSRMRIVCGYRLYERATSEGPQDPKICEGEADVRLRKGARRPTSTTKSLGCRRRF